MGGVKFYTSGITGTAVYNGNTGFLIGTLPNPGLRWEKTKTAEVSGIYIKVEML